MRKKETKQGSKNKTRGRRKKKLNLSVFGRTLPGTSTAAWQDASGPHYATYQTYCGDELHLPSTQHLSVCFTASFVVASTCSWPLRPRVSHEQHLHECAQTFLIPAYFSTLFCVRTFAALSIELFGTRQERTNVPHLSIIIINYHRDNYSSC